MSKSKESTVDGATVSAGPDAERRRSELRLMHCEALQAEVERMQAENKHLSEELLRVGGAVVAQLDRNVQQGDGKTVAPMNVEQGSDFLARLAASVLQQELPPGNLIRTFLVSYNSCQLLHKGKGWNASDARGPLEQAYDKAMSLIRDPSLQQLALKVRDRAGRLA